MARQARALGFNNPNRQGYLHREHIAKKNRKHKTPIKVKIYKEKLKELKEEANRQVLYEYGL